MGGVGGMVAGLEVTYQTNASAVGMANTLFGDGVTITSGTMEANHINGTVSITTADGEQLVETLTR